MKYLKQTKIYVFCYKMFSCIIKLIFNSNISFFLNFLIFSNIFYIFAIFGVFQKIKNEFEKKIYRKIPLFIKKFEKKMKKNIQNIKILIIQLRKNQFISI